MRLLIVATLAIAWLFSPVAVAQTAGPTPRQAAGSGAHIKSAPAKAKSARRVAKRKRMVHHAKATTKPVSAKPAAHRAPATKA